MKNILLRILKITAISCAVLCATWFLMMSWFSYTNTWKYCADFSAYKDDFIKVKDYVASAYEGNEGFIYVCRPWLDKTDKYDLYDPEMRKYFNCPEDVSKALETIDKYAFTYKDSVLDVIRIRGNKISFKIENGQYALVYSPDGRPTYLNRPDESFDIFCRYISSGWYHVVRNPNS